jgi:hypothetical protein
MGPQFIFRLIAMFEDRIVETILRQPGFHRAVGRIHRTIHEKRHGRDPHNPLSPGEATGTYVAPGEPFAR